MNQRGDLSSLQTENNGVSSPKPVLVSHFSTSCTAHSSIFLMSNLISRSATVLFESRHLEELARHYDDVSVPSLPRATVKHRLRITYWAQSLACSVDQDLYLHVTASLFPNWTNHAHHFKTTIYVTTRPK